jgi:hypothetical protein
MAFHLGRQPASDASAARAAVLPNRLAAGCPESCRALVLDCRSASAGARALRAVLRAQQQLDALQKAACPFLGPAGATVPRAVVAAQIALLEARSSVLPVPPDE